MYTDPPTPSPERNPLELWTFALAAALGWPIAFGLTPLPNALEHSPIGQATALLWWVGSLLGLGGLMVPGRWRYAGLRLEQVGCLSAGVGLVFYAVAVGVFTDWSAWRGVVAFASSLGLGLGCLWRVGQIRKYMERRRQHLIARAAEAKIAAQLAEQPETA